MSIILNRSLLDKWNRTKIALDLTDEEIKSIKEDVVDRMNSDVRWGDVPDPVSTAYTVPFAHTPSIVRSRLREMDPQKMETASEFDRKLKMNSLGAGLASAVLTGLKTRQLAPSILGYAVGHIAANKGTRWMNPEGSEASDEIQRKSDILRREAYSKVHGVADEAAREWYGDSQSAVLTSLAKALKDARERIEELEFERD